MKYIAVAVFCGTLAACHGHAQTKPVVGTISSFQAESTKREGADRADWDKRGVTGIVASKSGGEITLKLRTLSGEKQTVVTVNDGTKYKRYAPDSVKFADAKKSGLSDIAIGDQVRARGEPAEDVVFGSFLTKAGTITAVDAAAKEVTVKDLSTGKLLVIRITGDSRVKRMLDREGMIRMMHGSAAEGHGGGHEMPLMSLNEMLVRLPDAKVEELKAGDVVVVTGTKGAKSDTVTAISMLANAEILLEVVGGQSGPGGADALGAMGFGVMW